MDVLSVKTLGKRGTFENPPLHPTSLRIMSSGGYIPMQQTMQQTLQPCSMVFSDQYTNSNAYWGPPDTLATFSQPWFPEGMFDHNATFSIDQHYQNIPLPLNKDYDCAEGFAKPKKVRAIQVRRTSRSGIVFLANIY